MPTCMERETVVSCWLMGPALTRKAGKSRLGCWRTRDFKSWRSTSAATASRMGRANLISTLLLCTSTYSLPSVISARRARRVLALVGGSMGGSAAAQATIDAQPGEIDRLVLLAATAPGSPEKLKGRKLFIVARDDTSGAGPRLPAIRAQYEKTPEPKELIVVEGSAHAQFLFQTDQGDRVMREILRFLSAP